MALRQIIKAKADGKELSDKDIVTLIGEINDKTVDDIQLAAFLMATYIRGMTVEESVSLTREMTKYGGRLDWSDKPWKHLVVDKHSTGGVGDKVSLALAPAVAACGAKVPMISGRGLELTGGTLDKLEAIHGFKVEMPSEDLKRIMDDVGVFIAGQTSDIAPVDKRMYGIRDATGTVKCQPLIVGSIMSKKAIEGLKGLVLDVKVGDVTFMKTQEEAEELANSMINVGKGLDIKTTAIITRMESPVGVCIGNALEVVDALWVLNGKGSDDIVELVEQAGAIMLHSVGLADSRDAGRLMIRNALNDGSALRKFRDMLMGQGVSKDVADQLCTPGSLSADEYMRRMGCSVPSKREVKATATGVITQQDPKVLAQLSMHLGAGRGKKEDKLDYEAGIHLLKKVGDEVKQGETWAIVYHNKALPGDFDAIMASALKIEAGVDPASAKKMMVHKTLPE